MVKYYEFEKYFPDLEAFEKPDDSIVTYYDEVQESFYYDFLCKYIYQIREESADHFVETVAKDIAYGLALPDGEKESKTSALSDLKVYLLLSLRKLFLMKTFVAAPNLETFVRYFPEHKAHFSQFREGSKYLCRQILSLVPNLVSDCELKANDQMDLGRVIGAVVDLDKQTECESSDAAKENYVICLMIKHWKGTSKQSLSLILHSITNFHQDFDPEQTKFLPARKLPDLYRRFPEQGTEDMEDWYARLPEYPPLSAMETAWRFRNQMLPKLISSCQVRQSVDSLVSQAIYDSFMMKIRDAYCEDDFWEIRVKPDLRNQQQTAFRTGNTLVPAFQGEQKQQNSSANVPSIRVRNGKEGRPLIPTLKLINGKTSDKESASIPTLKKERTDTPQNGPALIPTVRVKREAPSKAQENSDFSNGTEVSEDSHANIPSVEKDISYEHDNTTEDTFSGQKPARKLRSWLPSAEEQFAAKISALLLKHPELCPNCLENHKLSQCSSIDADSRENIAAYFVPDYEQQVNQPRMAFLERCAERLSRKQRPSGDGAQKKSNESQMDTGNEKPLPMQQPKPKQEEIHLGREPSIEEKLKMQKNHIWQVSKEFKLGKSCDISVTNNLDLLTNVVPCEGFVAEDADGGKYNVDTRGELVYWKYAIPCYFVPACHGSVLSMKDFKRLNKFEKVIFADKKDRLSLNNKISLDEEVEPIRLYTDEAENFSIKTKVAEQMNKSANHVRGDVVPKTVSSASQSPAPDSRLNGFSQESESVISERVEHILQRSTCNETIRDLLRTMAKDHSAYLFETSKTSKLQVKETVNGGSLPSFAADVQVYMPFDKSVRHLEMHERYISGIFVGLHEKDRRVNLVWTNYSRPGEKMNVVLADKVEYTHQFNYIRIAEKQMLNAEERLTLMDIHGLAKPSYYRNLNVERVTQTAIDVKTSVKVLKFSPIDKTPAIMQTVLSEEVRETFMQQVQIKKRRLSPNTFLSVASARKLLAEVEDQKA